MKKNAKKTAAKKTAPPKQAKGPLGKTSGKTRTGWFVDYFKAHRGNLPSDEKIMANAVKEFGEGNVGAGTVFSAAQQRGWFNTFCRRGERGLTKKDAITETVKA